MSEAEGAYVVCVILDGNRPPEMAACLESLAQSHYLNQTLLVVEYAPRPGSAELIAGANPAAQIIVTPDNRGYAGNNNFGIRWAMQHQAEWVFILNDDTVLAPDCLECLLEVAQTDSRIGMLGPMIYHSGEPDIIQSAGGQLGPYWRAIQVGRNERDAGQYPTPRQVEWLSGCALLVRRAIIEQIGLMDERFFSYWEEIDWGLRASHAGWRLVHVPQARLWHKGAARDYQPLPAVTYYTTRNHFLLLAKNHAPLRAWLALAVSTARTLLSWTLKPRWRAMRPHRDAMLKGVLDFARGRWGMRSL